MAAVESEHPSAVIRQGGVHFPGLNGMRFWASIAILFYHIEVFKQLRGMPSWGQATLWKWMGPYSLVSFFALSGFLITFLLLEEMRRTQTVDLAKFHVRRILRIWPLYYLIVVLGFSAAYLFSAEAGLPHAVDDHHLERIALFLLLMPNLAWKAFGVLPFVGPLWSIGVEQQFYLSWPYLMRKAAPRIGAMILWFIGVVLALRIVLPPLARLLSPETGLTRGWQIGLGYLDTMQLECMAVGGLGALVVHRRMDAWLSFLFRPATQIGSWVVILICASLRIRFGVLDNLIWGGLFTLMIVNIGSNPSSLLKLENPWLDYLGKITFGLYLYHNFAIVSCLVLLEGRFPADGFAFNALLYGLTMAITFTLAALSYRFYEEPLLNLKRRYTVVKSEASIQPGA